MSAVFAPVGSTYVPPLSVWDVIAERIAVSEHQEIRKLIGDDVIDTAADLRAEALNLFDILKDARSMVDATPVTYSILPESDELRSRLRSEIVNLVEMLRDKAQTFDIDVNDLLKRHNKHVIDYAYDSSNLNESRPSTSNRSASLASSTSAFSSAAQTPRQTSAESARSESRQSPATRLAAALQQKVGYMTTGPVLQELRNLFEDEISQLQADIKSINQCIERVVDSNASDGSHWSEPTLSELKTERNKLEKEVVTELPVALRVSPSGSRQQSAASQKKLPTPPQTANTQVRRGDSAKSIGSSEEVIATLLKTNTSASAHLKESARAAKVSKPTLLSNIKKTTTAAADRSPAPLQPTPPGTTGTAAPSAHAPAIKAGNTNGSPSNNVRVNRFRNMVMHCRDDKPT